MKKTHVFLIFFLMSSFLFAQIKKNDKPILVVSDEVTTEINSIKNSSKAWTDSIHYDGDFSNGVGVSPNPSKYGFYMLIPTDSLVAHNGKYLNDVKLYINKAEKVHKAELRLYTDTSAAPVYTKPFTPIEGWNSIDIIPYKLPQTGYLVVGYFLSARGYPAGSDAGPAQPNGYGGILYFNGWKNASDFGINRNFNIRAMIGDLPANPVAYIFPKAWNTGNVHVGESKTATFTLANAGQGTLTCSSISGITVPFTTDFSPASVNLGPGESKTFTITFIPGNESEITQTATIATSAGDVTINLSGKGIDCEPISNFPWTDNFESGLNSCYTLLDEDGDGFRWEYAYNLDGLETNSGVGAIFSASYTNNINGVFDPCELRPDNWIILPPFDFSNTSSNYNIKYFVTGQSASFSEEHYGVYVSTTNREPASFTLIHEETLPANLDVFLERILSLDAYKDNLTVWIAFRHFNSYDNFFINIDDITVDNKVNVSENEKYFGIFPNPANDYVKVYTSELSNITITDLRGSVVYAGQVNNNDIISTENFMSGLYIVTIETKNNISRTKLIIN